MPSISACPECHGQVQIPEEFFGRRVKCPTCGAQFMAARGPSASRPAVSAPQRHYENAEDEDDDDEYEEVARPRRRRRPSRYYEPHRGTAILVLGILSLVLCHPLGIFAWVMGNSDLAQIRSGVMDPEGEGTTQAGRICGIIGTVIMILLCGVYGLMFLVVGAGGVANGFR